MKTILVLISIWVLTAQAAWGQSNLSSSEMEAWVREELVHCEIDQQTSDKSFSGFSSMLDSNPLRPALEHPNGWYYPAGSSNYQYLGWLGLNSGWGYHLAQDMANPLGDPVYAVDIGDVIYSDACVGGYGGPDGSACGGALVIQHRAKDGTWFTALYGHLNGQIPVNSHVFGGPQVIGFSNNWNPPHVHFGVKIGYRPDGTCPSNSCYRGYTSSTSNTYGYTNPINFLGNYSACKNGSSVNYRPNNGPPTHPNGSFIKIASNGTVYLLQNGQKRAISDLTYLRNLYPNGGFDYNDIITVAQDEFDRYPTGAIINTTLPSNNRTHPDGRLIKRATGGEISIVSDNGMRRGFVSATVFTSLGYLWCNVVDATDSNYDSYPVGAPVTGQGGATPTNTPTRTATATSTNTPTRTPTNTPTYTPTRTPTNTPVNTPTSAASSAPTWTATNTPTPVPTGSPIAVSLPDLSGATGSVITVPITVEDLTGWGVVSYECQVSFDPAVVQPASPSYDTSGTLSGNALITPNPGNPGHLIINGFQTGAMSGAGTLLKLKFNVVGTSGQSGLTFEDYTDLNGQFHHGFIFNEGLPSAITTPGSITVDAGAVSGRINYGNAVGSPNPRPVPSVNVCVQASPPTCTQTATDGSYGLSGLGSGPYTMTASKTGGVNGISAFDAALIAQHVAGTLSLSDMQKVAADVSGNGSVSSFDAAYIGSYVAGSSPNGSTGTWKFLQPGNPYQSVINTTVDFSGLLMGDVSGNWSNTGSRPTQASDPEKTVTVRAPFVTCDQNDILIPISIEGLANKGIISYEFDLEYDPAVILPQRDPIDLVGTQGIGFKLVANTDEPGILKVAAYGSMPIADVDELSLTLRFTAVGTPGAGSPLKWARLMFNEGEPDTVAIDGQVILSALAPRHNVELSGRLLNPMGRGIPNAAITLTDTAGQTRTAISNTFGAYRFGRLRLGETYFIGVDSRSYSFIPLAVSVIDEALTQDLIAKP